MNTSKWQRKWQKHYHTGSRTKHCHTVVHPQPGHVRGITRWSCYAFYGHQNIKGHLSNSIIIRCIGLKLPVCYFHGHNNDTLSFPFFFSFFILSLNRDVNTCFFLTYNTKSFLSVILCTFRVKVFPLKSGASVVKISKVQLTPLQRWHKHEIRPQNYAASHVQL